MEIAADRLVALSHQFVDYEDGTATQGFGVCPDILLCLRYKRRDENAPVYGRIPPSGEVACNNGVGIRPMNYHLLFEGVLQQLKIAVRLIGDPVDNEVVDPPEIFRKLPTYSQSQRIFPNVTEKGGKRTVFCQNLVVEVFLEYGSYSARLLYFDFKPCDDGAKRLADVSLHEEQDMRMVGHNRELENPDSGFQSGDGGYLFANNLPERSQLHRNASRLASINSAIALEMAKLGSGGCLT